MRNVSAMVVTEDELLLPDIRKILSEHDIQYHELYTVEEMEQEERNFAYYLIDEWMIDTLDQVKIPPSSVLIGLVRDRSFENARNWLKLGARELVIVPDEIETLDSILKKPYLNFIQDPTEDYLAFDGAGAVRVFYSAKGGTGKTTIAAMVAQNLQLQFDQRVILIDFNVQFGGVEVVFGLEPERSYIDLLPVINELSINHIQNVAVKDEETGIHVLLSPSTPEQIELISEELITRVIRTCRNHFDQVIIDLPSAFNTTTFTALSEATHIYYVLNPDSLSVRTLKHTVQLFRRYQIGNQNNVFIVINRNNNKSELSEKNIAQLVDLPIAGTVKADFYGLQPNLNMGRPFYLKKNDKGVSKTAQDVRAMVRKTMIKGV